MKQAAEFCSFRVLIVFRVLLDSSRKTAASKHLPYLYKHPKKTEIDVFSKL